MKSIKWLCALTVAAMVAGCGGGGGGSGDSPFNNNPCSSASAASGTSSGCASSTAQAIDVIGSSTSVGTGGETITVSAIVKGPGNVSLASAPIVFSTSTGTLSGASSVTTAAGVATATFSAGADHSNRTATITVRSGSATGTLSIEISGTKLAYSGATTVALNGTTVATVKATDSKGNAIANLAVDVKSSLNNGLSATSVTTDGQGSASVTYTATNAGADTLTFTAGGATVASMLQISSAQFSFVAPAASTSVTVGSSQALTVRYLINNVPQAGKLINFSATAGAVSPSSATTDASGQATVSISSATSSPAIVQATVSGASAQATLQLNFVAQAAARLVLQVSPTAIGPNASGSTAKQAQLRATVYDANSNPVQGATVTFNRTADPSGGNLSQASAVTDASGQATVQYIAGALTTANNGVQVTATVLGTSVSGSTQLTVAQSALFIALGTGNTITNLDEQTYKKDWVVYVTDANGVAVPGVNLTIKVLPVEYAKGRLLYQGSFWSYDTATLHVCSNEDDGAGNPANAYNGVLDSGEDFNGDGRLQPGNVISLTTATTTTAAATGTAQTDASGRATITLLYAESYVPWVKVRLVAQAIVSGTESSTDALFYVTGSASDFNSQSIPPAGVISPFGRNDCGTPN